VPAPTNISAYTDILGFYKTITLDQTFWANLKDICYGG
jgi:predicted DNA-binding ribbon-helix-helix protein